MHNWYKLAEKNLQKTPELIIVMQLQLKFETHSNFK